jgi:cysteine-rich repeat protein
MEPVADACQIAADVAVDAAQFKAACGKHLGTDEGVAPLSVTLAQCQPVFCGSGGEATNAGDQKVCGYRIEHLLCCPAQGSSTDASSPRIDPSVAVLEDANGRIRQVAQVDVSDVQLIPTPVCACCGEPTSDDGLPVLELNTPFGSQLRGWAIISTSDVEQDTPLNGQTFTSPEEAPKFAPTYYGDDVNNNIDKTRRRRAVADLLPGGLAQPLKVQGINFNSATVERSGVAQQAQQSSSALQSAIAFSNNRNSSGHGICLFGKCYSSPSYQIRPGNAGNSGPTLTAQFQMFARVGTDGPEFALPNGMAAARVPYSAQEAAIDFQEGMYLPSQLVADLQPADALQTCGEFVVVLSLRQVNLAYGPAGRDTKQQFSVLARTAGCRATLCGETGKCSDPDEALPLAERTTVTGLQTDDEGNVDYATRTDYCIDSNTVMEFYCTKAGIAGEPFKCGDGTTCYKGACQSCIDRDGYDLSVASHAFLPSSEEILADVCAIEGGSYILEATCDKGGKPTQIKAVCPRGQLCYSGACRQEAPPRKAPIGDAEVERTDPSRRRRGASSGGSTAFSEGFPTGICGCGSVFPDDAKGSYFSLDNGGTVLSEADLEGLTRAEIGRLYFHPVANYFGRIGFTAFGVSLENGTETAITPAPIGITVNSDNDAPSLALSSSSEVTASVFDVVALPAVTMQDVDALDGTVQLRVYSRSLAHKLYLWPVPAGVRLVEQVEDPRAQDPAGPERQSVANGQFDLYIQATLVNGSLTLDGLWLEALATDSDDSVIFEMSDLFFSALDRGSEGRAQTSVDLAVGPPFPAPVGVQRLPRPTRSAAGLVDATVLYFSNLTGSINMPFLPSSAPFFTAAPGVAPGQTFSLTLETPVVSFDPALPASGTVAELNSALQLANVTWPAGNYSNGDKACAFPIVFRLDGEGVTSVLLFPTAEALAAVGLPGDAQIVICGDGEIPNEANEAPGNVSITVAPEAPACSEGASVDITLDVTVANTSSNAAVEFLQVLVWLADGSVTRRADAAPLGGSSNVTDLAPAPPAALLPAGVPAVVHLAGSPDEVMAAITNLTLWPSPDFNGDTILYVDVITFDDNPGIGAVGLHDERLHDAAGVLRFSFDVSVSPVADPIRLLTPGYLFLRELEATTLWSIYIMDADTADDDMDYTVEVSTSLGAISLLPSLQSNLGVTLHGGAASMPASGFTLVGTYGNIAAAMGGITFHATACDFAPGACESRYSTLEITATDPTGNTAQHSIIVDITCIAEVPLLEAPEVSGDEDTAIPLSIYAAPRDPAERVIIYFENFPPGVTFNNGQANGRRWRLEPDDLTGLTVRSVANSHDDFTFNVTAIAIEISNGDTASNTTVQRVTLYPVNDEPDVAAPGTQYALEDTVSRLGVPAVISDRADLPGGTGGDYEVVVTVSDGVLRYGLLHGNETGPPTCATLGLTACSGYDTPSISLRGPMEDVNAALGTLFYLGDANFEGNDELEFFVNDHGTEGSGGALTATDSSLLIVLPVNDAPTISMASTPQGGCVPDIENRTCLPVIQSFRPREDCLTWMYNTLNLADIDEKGDNFTFFLNAHFGQWTLNPFADYSNIVFERGDGLNDRAMMLHGPLVDIQATVSLMAYQGLENFHGWDTLAITLKDRPTDSTGAEVTEAAFTFEVRPVNDAPLLSVAAGRAILQPGGSTSFSLNVVDDQYLNTSLAAPTALMNSQTRVRVYLGAAHGTFTVTAPTLATIVNNGANLVSIDGTIEDVNDALLDITFDLDATIDGSTPLRRFDTAHFLVHDWGREGFCDCTSDPGLVNAPLASCNRFDYANHSVLVLDCQGDKVPQSAGPGLWLYGSRPLDTFSDFDGDGELDASFDGRPVVDLSVPANDNRTGWDYSGWSIGVGGFGFLDDFSPCPLLTGAGLRTDLTGQSIKQYMARSWFYVSPGTINVKVRLTSDWPLHLYVNGDLVGTHAGTSGHLEGPVCPTSTDIDLPFWYAPDFPHRDEDDTYLNEISLLAHPNATFFDGEVLAISCQNPDTCRRKDCVTNADCGPTCSCGERRYDASTASTLYRQAQPSEAVKRGVCLPNRCGNGMVDSPLEECDDGNLIDNDGCSNHCRRNVAEGRCIIDRLSLEEAKARYDQVLALLRQNPEDEALLAEAERLEQMLELLGAGKPFDGRLLGFDRYGRFCAGSCPLSGRVCEGVFSSDGTVLEECLCGDGQPDVCAMRVVENGPTDASGVNPSAGKEGVDAFGRYCSGYCPITGELCAGSWTLQEGKDVLLRCGCRGEGCFLDRRANEGRGACSGGCTQEVEVDTATLASAAQQLTVTSLARKQCVATYYEDRVASCDCPDENDPSPCKLSVDPKTGAPRCGGECPETGKACVLERDESFGGARCTCPKPEPTDSCRPNYYARVPSCSGKCAEGESHACLSVYYASAGKPQDSRLAGCQCSPRVEEGCSLKLADGADPQCGGECANTGTRCRLYKAGRELLCGCAATSADPDVHGPCRVNRELNTCEGATLCGDKTARFCEPIFMAGDRVEKCGCPSDGVVVDKGCVTKDNVCYGGCEKLGVPCRGSYLNGRLQSCGCPESSACEGCRPYNNDACVLTAGCRGQSVVSMELTLEAPPLDPKTGTGISYGQISGSLSPRFLAPARDADEYKGPLNIMLAPGPGVDEDCNGICKPDPRTDVVAFAKKYNLAYTRGLSFRLQALSYGGDVSVGTLELLEPMDFTLKIAHDAVFAELGKIQVEDVLILHRADQEAGAEAGAPRPLRPLEYGPRCKGRYEPKADFKADTFTLAGQLCGTGSYHILLRTASSEKPVFTTTATATTTSTTFTAPATTTTTKARTTSAPETKMSSTATSTAFVKTTTRTTVRGVGGGGGGGGQKMEEKKKKKRKQV